MVKGTVTIPKETQDCKDGKCGHTHEIQFEMPTPEAIQVAVDAPVPPTAPTPAPEQHQGHDHIEVNHKQLGEIMPLGTNYAPCADGSCGNSVIENSKLTKKFKKCTNCNSNTVAKKSEICPTCGIKPTDEEKEDFWEDSDIESEKIGEEED